MKKLLTSLLCVMMVVCFMPAMAWADDGDTTQSPVAQIGDTTYTDLQIAVNTAEALVEVEHFIRKFPFIGQCHVQMAHI